MQGLSAWPRALEGKGGWGVSPSLQIRNGEFLTIILDPLTQIMGTGKSLNLGPLPPECMRIESSDSKL